MSDAQPNKAKEAEKTEKGEAKWMKVAKERLTFIQLIATILIAIGGFYLNFQQNHIKEQQAALSQKIQMEKVTHDFVDQVTKNLDKLKLDPNNNRDIIISLLDIITEANLQENKVDTAFRELLPLRIALVAGSYEMLAHLAHDGKERDQWIALAENSGNTNVKTTAIQALEQIGKNSKTDEDLTLCLRKMRDISENFTNKGLLPVTVAAIDNLLDIVESDPSRQESLLLTHELAMINVSLLAMEKGRPNYINSVVLSDIKGYRKRINRLLRSDTLMGDNVKRVVKTKTKPAETDSFILNLIVDLESADKHVRRAARNRLVILGQEAVSPILGALKKDPDNYRIKMGGAYVLFLMDPPPKIQKKKSMERIIHLIGDNDELIRKYSTDCLAKMHDPASINVACEIFGDAFAKGKEKDGNLVYNAVVVLGEWHSSEPEFGSKIETLLQDLRVTLDQDTIMEWPKTIKRIDKVLRRRS